MGAIPSRFSSTIIFGLSALCSTAAMAGGTVPSFVQNGTLKVCTAGDFPPMEYYEHPGDTQMVGVEIDVVSALARIWNAKPDFVIAPFTGLLSSLEARRCDLVASGISVTPERLKTYDALPYFTTAVVVLTPASDTATARPEDLSGKVIAIEAGTTYEARAADLNSTLRAGAQPEVTVQTYPSAAAVIQQILVGRAAATFTQDTTAIFRRNQMPDALRIAYTYPDHNTYGLYLRRSGDDLQSLRQAFATLRQSGELAAIAARWGIAETALDAAAGPQ
ncbi:ABC transporter substrate-binding protein [Inquilinus limosus]|uniref:ABC transporter substrate-binding protein n=1 Tax=Inquilinus limosus TaxID=171674 RepID=A0A211ZN03_9PROT|nr:ABC transporter substrate-binding protein [Inquilinus limosus]